MKTFKIIFFILTFGVSFYFAWQISVSFFGINPFSKKKSELTTQLKDGDMIFQTSQSSQCEALRIATKSKFSHCGIIYIKNGKSIVYEAVQPVKITPMEDWIKRGKGKNYVIKRLKNAEKTLTPYVLSKMKLEGEKFNNKDYDLYFEWSDNKIYCSELLWKIYKNGANIELCNLQKLKDFNLNDKKVKVILKERYGNKIPLDEKVIAPSQIVNSAILETIIDTY